MIKYCYVEGGKLEFNSMNIDIELISHLFKKVYYWHPSPPRVTFSMHTGPVSKEAQNVSWKRVQAHSTNMSNELIKKKTKTIICLHWYICYK